MFQVFFFASNTNLIDLIEYKYSSFTQYSTQTHSCLQTLKHLGTQKHNPILRITIIVSIQSTHSIKQSSHKLAKMKTLDDFWSFLDLFLYLSLSKKRPKIVQSFHLSTQHSSCIVTMSYWTNSWILIFSVLHFNTFSYKHLHRARVKTTNRTKSSSGGWSLDSYYSYQLR